jgi:hypothetical protein
VSGEPNQAERTNFGKGKKEGKEGRREGALLAYLLFISGQGVPELDGTGGGTDVAGGTVDAVAEVVDPQVHEEFVSGGLDAGLGHGDTFAGGFGDDDVQLS